MVGLGLRAPPGVERGGGEKVRRFFSVTLLNSEVCERKIAIKRLNSVTIFIPLDRERFLVVHLKFNSVSAPLVGTNTEH